MPSRDADRFFSDSVVRPRWRVVANEKVNTRQSESEVTRIDAKNPWKRSLLPREMREMNGEKRPMGRPFGRAV